MGHVDLARFKFAKTGFGPYGKVSTKPLIHVPAMFVPRFMLEAAPVLNHVSNQKMKSMPLKDIAFISLENVTKSVLVDSLYTTPSQYYQ